MIQGRIPTMVKRALLCLLVTVWAVSALPAETHTVAAGTKLNCRLIQTLSTKMNFQNDPFQARVSEPLMFCARRTKCFRRDLRRKRTRSRSDR